MMQDGRFYTIDAFDREETRIYQERSEIPLLRYHEPEPGLFIAESARVALRALKAGYEAVSVLVAKDQLDKEDTRMLLEASGQVPVYVADAPLLDRITGYHLTRGVLCACKRKRLPDVAEILYCAKRLAVLERIGNPANVGALFRNCAALHMDGILLTKGCADPLYRRAIRVSMGCVFALPWTVTDTSYVTALRDAGFTTVALALKEDAQPLSEWRPRPDEKIALFFGTENDGLSPETIASCDKTVCIPMANGVDSLNVAAAGAIACWHLWMNRC